MKFKKGDKVRVNGWDLGDSFHLNHKVGTVVKHVKDVVTVNFPWDFAGMKNDHKLDYRENYVTLLEKKPTVLTGAKTTVFLKMGKEIRTLVSAVSLNMNIEAKGLATAEVTFFELTALGEPIRTGRSFKKINLLGYVFGVKELADGRTGFILAAKSSGSKQKDAKEKQVLLNSSRPLKGVEV